jgi:PAB1-binding protein PBP1
LFFGDLSEDVKDTKWDQFTINKEKFNVDTTYDEKQYTTELNHENIPKQVKVKADKIAKVN